MNDSDPRPMPPTVLAAYRDPLNLTELLTSEVFADSERWAVRDELLERLIKKHGNVEVEIGKGTRTLPIRKRVAQFKKSVWGSIEVMIAAEELCGRERVMLELAAIMEPFWLRWWKAMSWDFYESMTDKLFVCSYVIGDRQIAWLAAQYARSAIERTVVEDRQVALDAILAAEAWAIVPSVKNRKQAKKASNSAYVSYSAARIAAAYAAGACFSRAYNAATSAAVYAYLADATEDTDRAASRSRLSELTKQLITPTLITHAFRELR